MGNVEGLHGVAESENEQLSRELDTFQEKIVSIDEAITKLMQTIDVVCGTAKVLEDYLRNQTKDVDDTNKLEQVKYTDERKEKSYDLLVASQELLSSQQHDSLGKLSDFFEFANNKIDEYFPCPQKWSVEFQLNAYIGRRPQIKINSEVESLYNQHVISKNINQMEMELAFVRERNRILKIRESTYIAAEKGLRLEKLTIEKEIEEQKKINENNGNDFLKLLEEKQALSKKATNAEEENAKLLESLGKLQKKHRQQVETLEEQIKVTRNNHSKSQSKKSFFGAGVENSRDKRLRDNESKDDTICKLQQEVESKRLEFVQLEEQNKLKTGQIIEKEQENASLQETIKRLENDITSLENKLKEKEECLNTTTKQNGEIKSDAYNQIQKEKHQTEALRREISKKEEVVKQLQSEMEKQTETIVSYRDEIDKSKQQMSKLESELQLIKAKKTMQIQLYSSNRGDMMCEVESELIKLVRDEIENDHLQLEFVKCARHSDIRPDLPTLTLCITVSRLGTDVSNAIQGLSLTRKMALMIFHLKDKHALPNQASDRVLTGTDLSDVGGIFDVGFLAGKGFHKCPLNTNNFVSLVTFIKREGKENPIC